MRLRQRQKSMERLSSTAGDAAGALVEVIGNGVKGAGERVAPTISAVSQQLPEVAGRLASSMQPVADTAQKRAAEALETARGRSSEFADRVVQAAYEASKSLPDDTRKKVEGSLRKSGIKPKSKKRRPGKVWIAGGVLALAGVAFLFSGTVQDKVYDLVDRIRGEDEDGADFDASSAPPVPGRDPDRSSD